VNKVEQARVDAMASLGCVACAHLGLPNIASDLHHILAGGRRLGDWYTICLCPGHHRGAWTAEQLEAIPTLKRVAISDGRKLFTRQYPTERELWEIVQQRLGLPDIWPASKILPRGWRVYGEA